MRISKLALAGIVAGFIGLLANEVLTSTPHMLVAKDQTLKAAPQTLLCGDSFQAKPRMLIA